MQFWEDLGIVRYSPERRVRDKGETAKMISYGPMVANNSRTCGNEAVVPNYVPGRAMLKACIARSSPIAISSQLKWDVPPRVTGLHLRLSGMNAVTCGNIS
jgi:hypothetical protein